MPEKAKPGSRMEPPNGMIRRDTAVKILKREKIIRTPTMIEKLKIEHITPPGRKHGYYVIASLLNFVNEWRAMKNQPPLTETTLFEEQHKLVFRQAEPKDMIGVYDVAHQLFGHTTSAEARMPLVQLVPEGNYILLDRDVVVAYIHLQPLKSESLQRFLSGKIRGSGLTEHDLDPFESGKVVDVLVKSVGAYHEQKRITKWYAQILFRNLQTEIIKWGQKGYIINRVYATSETPSGIEMALDTAMIPLGRIPGSARKKRFAFYAEPLSHPHQIFMRYRNGLAQWREEHEEEYEQAWTNWKQTHDLIK